VDLAPVDEDDSTGLSEEELLRDPRAQGPPGMKRVRFKSAFYGTDRRARELRKKLAYQLGGKHNNVLRL